MKEGLNIGFKKVVDDLPKTIWETYSSFANTDGGKIYLGVAEDKETGEPIYIGVNDVDKILDKFWTTLNNINKVSHNLLRYSDVKVLNIENKDIIEITVPKASREYRPVYINNNLNGGTYIRQGDGDFKCGREALYAMIRDSGSRTDDYELLKDMNIKDLSIDTIESYRRIFRTLKPDHYWNELSNEDFLIRIGALAKSKGEVYCTKAGLLMFGYDYNIIRVFPNYFMDYRENITELSRYDYRVETGDGNSEGNIFRFFTKTMNILNNSVNEPFRMQNSLYREGDSSGKTIIREAVLNAITNADFNLSNNVIIERVRNKIIISNSGGFRVPINSGLSDPRNSILIGMFRNIHNVERAGTGIRKIFDVSKDYNWEVNYEEKFNPDRVTLTLSGVDNLNYRQSELEKMRII